MDQTTLAPMTETDAASPNGGASGSSMAPVAQPQMTAPPATPKAVSPDIEAIEALSISERLPSSVEDVQIVSPWTEDIEEGVWRTIMVRSASATLRYRFFLQKLVVKEGVSVVRATTKIREIHEIEGSVVGYRAAELATFSPSSLTLYFDIVPWGGEVARSYRLLLRRGAPYEFGRAPD